MESQSEPPGPGREVKRKLIQNPVEFCNYANI